MNLNMAKQIVATMKAARNQSVQLDDDAPHGFLSIYKQYDDGVTETVLDNDPNIITFASRRHHLRFLYDPSVTQDLLNAFKVGTGGAVGSDESGNDNVRIIPPDPARNDLFAPVILGNTSVTLTPSDEITEPDQVYLQIIFSLNQDDANGLRISECGLFKEMGDMFNHKTFRPIDKSESFSLIFDWRIRYI